MNYRILFFVITLTILLMGSVLFFVVSAGAKQAQNQVLMEQQGRDLTNPAVTKAIFTISDPNFEEFNHSCKVPFLDQTYINVIMSYRETPRSCEFFVNDKFITAYRDLKPDCIGECPYGEFSRTFALGHHDVREDHIIRICCNDICIEKSLQALCPFSAGRENISG